jgi:GTPase Era involved in 16S rRNA processing
LNSSFISSFLQKIVVGKSGAVLKSIREQARAEISAKLKRNVQLVLAVRVSKNN